MNNSMEDRVLRLEAAAQIQYLVGRYSNLLTLERFSEIPALFALDYPDTRAEMLWGVYRGGDGVRRLYGEVLPQTAGAQSGLDAVVHALETPVITVARDGRTGKGVWVSPGYLIRTEPGGEKKGYWSWQKYGADFIFLEGRWYIWHLHVYGLFEAEYATGAIRPSGTYGCAMGVPEKTLAADGAPTTVFDLSPDSVYPYAPAVPTAYTVFDGDKAY